MGQVVAIIKAMELLRPMAINLALQKEEERRKAKNKAISHLEVVGKEEEEVISMEFPQTLKMNPVDSKK